MNESLDNFKKFIEVTSNLEKFKSFIEYVEELISNETINVEFKGNALGISNLKEENIKELEEKLSFNREEISNYTSMFTFGLVLAFGQYPNISKFNLSQEEINKLREFHKDFYKKGRMFQEILDKGEIENEE